MSEAESLPACRLSGSGYKKAAINEADKGRVRFWQYPSFSMLVRNDG
jgi:hypothetical protein